MSKADLFDAIADANRRYLLEELRRKPQTVGELAEGLPVSRPAVSQHLKVLLDAGLVSATADGTKRIYAIEEAGFTRLHIWLDQFWTED
ncbi:MAG: metalloregulator ArsR/SmtB family transcription factor [Pseudomonadota bacterium]